MIDPTIPQPIAIATYLAYGSELYTKDLFTSDQVASARSGHDDDIKDWKCIIVFGSGLRYESHT